MRAIPCLAGLASALLLPALHPARAQVLTRVPLAGLNLPADAPTRGFATGNALGSLAFAQPVAVVAPPGETNRLFVVHKPGRISVIPNLANPVPAEFLDIAARVGDSGGEQGLLALAFHPDFATNGRFFLWYTLSTTSPAGTGRHDRLAEFRLSAGNPNVADPASERPLITQLDQASNHNGGQLAFGPDGYLYVSLGDEGGGNDQYQNGQRIDRDFFASILRIDVDRRPGSLGPNPHPAVHPGTYAIPPDNPFVGATSFNGVAVDPASVRTEIWATGLRNPWRMSFDPVDGTLWAGDVGQGAREEIDVIVKGGNYGWPYREGFIAGPRGNPPAGAAFVDPVHDYPRTSGYSVTGGTVYRGARLAQLYGAYLFADYGSGRIWSLRRNAAGPPTVAELATDTGIVSFGTDPSNGDILLADIADGAIKRLTYNATSSGTPFPATLGATGAFTSLATLEPAAGFVSYEPNVPFWSDHAVKRRWFALPGSTSTFGLDPGGNWRLPAGAVWMKHFDLELTRGDPATSRRVETRFLVKTATGVYGVTYRWNDAQTEATLVPEEGAEQVFTVVEGGAPRTQTWHFPGRAECLACHTPQAGHALSFNTRQLNRSHAFPGGTANQIAALAEAGYLDAAPPSPANLPALVADRAGAPIEARARSYLDVNCAACHRPGGSALGSWDARAGTPLSFAGIVNGALVDAGSDAANRVIVPADAARSRLLHRMQASHGASRMPPLATFERDLAGEALIAQWIDDLAVARPPSALLNVSSRGLVGTGDNILIAGFVIRGSAPKSVLLRAVGPGLSEFGVPGPLSAPVLSLFRGNQPIGGNAGWGSAPDPDAIELVAARVGAFALAPDSVDAAMLATLDPALYSVHASGLGGATGIALIEVYDADETSGAVETRLINLSIRAQVGAGAEVVIPGIVIGAGATKRVLARAVGPGLAAYDVTGWLPRPTLTLFAGTEAFLDNTGWSGAANAGEIEAAAGAVGAFALARGDADSAILADLSPGIYTLHASSADGATGVVLVEVYEVP